MLTGRHISYQILTFFDINKTDERAYHGLDRFAQHRAAQGQSQDVQAGRQAFTHEERLIAVSHKSRPDEGTKKSHRNLRAMVNDIFEDQRHSLLITPRARALQRWSRGSAFFKRS